MFNEDCMHCSSPDGLNKIAGKSIEETSRLLCSRAGDYRIKHVSAINDIVIATTTDVQDDVIVEEAKRIGVHYYRGSEHDVLSRYYEVGKRHN